MKTDISAEKREYLFGLYMNMFSAREIDRIEESYTRRGEAFFHVSGGGHEAGAALAAYLKPEDWLHCHYRDKAMMLARGMDPDMFFHSLFNKDASHSRGRQMNAHMSDPALNILSLVGPVGNSGLQAAGIARAVKDQSASPIVLCSLGDGMSQQGEVLEAVAHAVRETLPVLFLIQDNGFAISTRTRGKTFYNLPGGPAQEFYGILIRRFNGRNPLTADEVFEETVAEMRKTRKPAILIMEVERLSNHTNADDQRVYRSEEEISRARLTGDPLLKLREFLVSSGMDEGKLEEAEYFRRTELEDAARKSQLGAEPKAVHDAVKPYPAKLLKTDETRPAAEGGEAKTMIETLREVLSARMKADERVCLFGEDIEDPKGDVFGVTRGLTDLYPGRVCNSPLAEASIVGIAGGEALAGRRPVAFLQFADFLPIAFNQIISELGSMYWRTDGGWQAPVIVMISCGGYKPGLGPFHAQSMDGIAAHTPGVDVFMPSRADDAAALLNAAFESERPTLFFYPKNLLNSRDFATTRPAAKLLASPGKARLLREGRDISLVGWGNTVVHCMRAAEALAEAGAEAEVIDLRTLLPWDREMVISSAEKTGRLIVVHEDTHTAGMGAEILSTLGEAARRPLQLRRVTRGDTYVPCNFANQLEVLPSFKRVLETAVELLEGSISWRKEDEAGGELYTLEAVGSSPSDEVVTVIEWLVAEGDIISEGQEIAELEADKAMVTLSSPVAGVVSSLDVAEGDSAKVGDGIAKIRLEKGTVRLKPVTREEPGMPVISSLQTGSAVLSDVSREGTAAIAAVRGVLGARLVSNEEISRLCPTWSPEDIVKRTGIKERHWIGEGENALTLTLDAAARLLDDLNIGIEEVDLLICSTVTPVMNTPAMATLVQYELNRKYNADCTCPAYDINAACSGYVYGLQIAHDYLAQKPDHKVLLVTVDVLSDRVDTADPATAPVFGDGATATMIVGGLELSEKGVLEIKRPVLSASGEDGSLLRIPADLKDPVYMEGPEVFRKAVTAMADILKDACKEAGIGHEELDLVIPHQANQRIIDAVRQKLKAKPEKVYSIIDGIGNISSSTIPLCLERILGDEDRREVYYGLTAFGGGFTFAGGVLKRIKE
jgi:2-oxoisovalerate dehydrogenase E1 component